VLRHREMLELVPGSSLSTLPQELEHASR